MPAQASKPEAVTIASLAHDLMKRQSIVTLIWGDGSERRIALPVPYGTTLHDIHQEAEAAVRQFPQCRSRYGAAAVLDNRQTWSEHFAMVFSGAMTR
jgi:hypothetical protein